MTYGRLTGPAVRPGSDNCAVCILSNIELERSKVSRTLLDDVYPDDPSDNSTNTYFATRFYAVPCIIDRSDRYLPTMIHS